MTQTYDEFLEEGACAAPTPARGDALEDGQVARHAAARGAPRVVGHCPMGCGPTLVLGHDGYVICIDDWCHNPNAAGDILAESETGHIVDLGEAGYAVKHPLRERLDGDLFACPLVEYLDALDASPHPPGRYRVVHTDHGDWTWQTIDTESSS
jgi:hypothetical protein